MRYKPILEFTTTIPQGEGAPPPPFHILSYPIPESTVTTIPQGAVIPGPSGRRSQVLAVSALGSVKNQKKKMKQTYRDHCTCVQNQSTEGTDCKKF